MLLSPAPWLGCSPVHMGTLGTSTGILYQREESGEIRVAHVSLGLISSLKHPRRVAPSPSTHSVPGSLPLVQPLPSLGDWLQMQTLERGQKETLLPLPPLGSLLGCCLCFPMHISHTGLFLAPGTTTPAFIPHVSRVATVPRECSFLGSWVSLHIRVNTPACFQTCL